MPVEIRELHIRVAVTPEAAKPGAAPQSAPAANEAKGEHEDAIVAECVEQVLEIIQARRER
jgi:Family of unknown function (DUF5908)